MVEKSVKNYIESVYHQPSTSTSPPHWLQLAADTTSWSALEDHYVHFTPPPPQQRGKGGNTGTADEGTPEGEGT